MNYQISYLDYVKISYVGAYHLESTIESVCIGPIIPWPNPRMAH